WEHCPQRSRPSRSRHGSSVANSTATVQVGPSSPCATRPSQAPLSRIVVTCRRQELLVLCAGCAPHSPCNGGRYNPEHKRKRMVRRVKAMLAPLNHEKFLARHRRHDVGILDRVAVPCEEFLVVE